MERAPTVASIYGESIAPQAKSEEKTKSSRRKRQVKQGAPLRADMDCRNHRAYVHVMRPVDGHNLGSIFSGMVKDIAASCWASRWRTREESTSSLRPIVSSRDGYPISTRALANEIAQLWAPRRARNTEYRATRRNKDVGDMAPRLFQIVADQISL
jgi:hypothetical protein